MEPAIIVALLGASVSLAVAVWNFFATRENQRAVEAIKQANAVELEERRAALQEAKAAQDARRGYEYEARKRLYATLEPLAFQLTGASDSAHARIVELARTARQGNLDGPHSWLGGTGEDYFLVSTMYRLMAPMGLVRVGQRQLTHVDLGLDPVMAFRHAIGRRLMLSFSEDFFLAQSPPSIPYDPDRAASPGEPPTDRRQGIYAGAVERATEAMVVTEGDRARVRSYGEFEAAMHGGDPTFTAAMAPLVGLLSGFHPRTDPVLWRILIAQAHLYRLLLAVRRGEASPESVAAALHIPDSEREPFDWRQPGEQERIDRAEVLEAPFAAAEAHLVPQLQRTLDLYRT